MDVAFGSESIKPSIDLRGIMEQVHNIFSIIGLFGNATLLYLIIAKTDAKLADYKKPLLQNCIVYFIYNIAQFITRMQIEYKDGNLFLLMTNAFGYIPPPYSIVFFAFWNFALFFCVTSIPVQFVYRYFLIIKNTRLTNQQFALKLFIAWGIAASYFCYTFYILWPRQPAYERNAKLLEADMYYFRGVPSFVTADVRDWGTFGLLLYCCIIVTSTYTIIIWTSHQVWKYFIKMANNMPTQAKVIHNQVTKTLLLQATIPVIVCFTPIGVSVVMIFLRADIAGFAIIVSMLLSWIPVVNSLITLIVIKSYRVALINMFKRPLLRRSEVSVTSVMYPNI